MNTIFSIQHIGDAVVARLSLKDRCSLAGTCKETRDFVYDPKWWPEVEFPYKGTTRNPETLTFIVRPYDKPIGLYSTLHPPPGPQVFEEMLEAMLPSKRRFSNITKVEFKNYMFSDRALELVAELFPSLEKLDLDGAKITEKGILLVQNFHKLRFLSVNCKYASKWDTRKWLAPLESHLERLVMNPSQTEFLKKCKQCNFYYNPKFNNEKSCLFHPGEYSGYGHSCSSFDCCGSNTPCYIGTPGCTYGFHNPGKGYCNTEWPPELYDVPYNDRMETSGYRYIGERRPPTCID